MIVARRMSLSDDGFWLSDFELISTHRGLMMNEPDILLSSIRLFGLKGTDTGQKGKSAIHLALVYTERKRGFFGQHFVSTVGPDEELIREYPQPELGRQTPGAVEPLAGSHPKAPGLPGILTRLPKS